MPTPMLPMLPKPLWLMSLMMSAQSVMSALFNVTLMSLMMSAQSVMSALFNVTLMALM